MLCAISGESPQEPVVSKKSGAVYEKRLIEQYIKENGTEPETGNALTDEDLLALKSSAIIRPRPPALTSIPALLATFQNEWDALALETYNLREQLARTREELATALYQHDAAVRVIVRLTRERNEARESLSKVTVTGSAANGEEMVVDSVEALPEALSERVEELQLSLSKERKKRPIPEDWVTADEISAFESEARNSLPLSQTTCLDLEGDYAALGSLKSGAALYSIQADSLERQISIDEPITGTLWLGGKLLFSTSHGSVKVYENGNEAASLSEHAGPATSLSSHPSGDIAASVGADKRIVFYDMNTMNRAANAFTDASLTTCAFHPDGHLFACSTVTGEVKLFMTITLEHAASFTLGAPVQAIAFSENGFWLAATAKGQSTVTIFDLRKKGDATTAKVLEVGGSVESLAWDYTGQFLATAGASGLTVQQYTKSSKKWSQILQQAIPAVTVRWGTHGKRLVSVNNEGVVTVLGVKPAES